MNLLPLISPQSKIVVEIGCTEGLLGARFKQVNPQCKYIGLLVDREYGVAAKIAKQIDQVIVCERLDFLLERIGLAVGEVDCLIYRNLIDWSSFPKTLARHLPFLRAGGQIILDFPNRFYAENVMMLLNGKGKMIDLSLKNLQTLAEDSDLFIDNVLPYSVNNQEWRDDPAFMQALGIILQRSGCNVQSPEILMKGYVITMRKRAEAADRLLLHTMLGETKVCARVRIVEPHAFCATVAGVKVVNEAFKADLSLGNDYQRKVFIRQRIWSELPQAASELKNLVNRGYLVISEMDDDPERWENIRSNDYFAFRGCHAVQTSTPALADYLRRFNPNVAVFANQVAFLPPKRCYQARERVRIFFGALNREADWQEYIELLNGMLLEYRDRIEVVVIHDRQFFAALAMENKTFVPFCQYSEYSRILHECDIAWLPLSDNRFNRLKSDLKFIECASHGVAVLSSPIVYGASVVQGITGFIYHNRQEFEQYLRLLLDNAAVRQLVGKNAYNYVREERMLAYHYLERHQWYESLLADLPRLQQELLTRNPELLSTE